MEKIDKKYQKDRFSNEEKRDYAGNIRSSAVKKLSKKYIGKKVLDIGSANGALIDLIPGAIGIDLAPKHPKVQEGDVTSMPFNKDSFDTIFTLEVLEHLDDETLVKGLSEIYRILKPEGYYIISVPYKENLKENEVLCPECGLWFHRNGHVRVFDEEIIQRLLQDNGFDTVNLEVLPLGSLGRHPKLSILWRLFYFLGLGFKPNTIFVVCRKGS